MEYIIIDQDKIKVMLKEEDLREWDVTADSLDYSEPRSKEVFEEILEYAKENFGFDTKDCKVLLELYPSKDGGCELFITKLNLFCDDLSPFEEDDMDKTASFHAFSFESADDLLALCARIHKNLTDTENTVRKSSAWIDEDDKWYLLIEAAIDAFDYSPFELSPISFFSEYAETLSYKRTLAYLTEYAKEIYKSNAVELLASVKGY